MGTLSKQAVERASKAKIGTTLWDNGLKGFGFRVSRTGKCSWLIKRRLGQGGRKAKQVLFVFGSYPAMDFDKAYTEALSLIASINNGLNPQLEKRKLRNQQHQDYANGKLKDVFKLWFQKHARPSIEPPKGSYWYEVRRRFKVEVLPKLGPETLIAEITKRDITLLIDNKEFLTRAGARQVFNAMRPFFKWCTARELIAVDPMQGLSPPERYKDRDRVLTDNELIAVWRAASSLRYPWGPFYRLLLLTAQRRDEVATMEWSEIDLEKREWLIPASKAKNGKQHLVHLSDWAVDILRTVAKDAGRKYVFTTHSKNVEGKHVDVSISGFSKAKCIIDKRIAERRVEPIDEWRVHDLRRTAATGMAALGVQPHVVERVLNHISGSTGGLVGVYQRFEYPSQRREAMTLWANHIQQLLLAEFAREREVADNVVPIRA